ncbi:MAG: hypothetical protein HY903_15915 [Deltaproteobacteria bacterium]|nr:hypothetical protein [Deltaproteobacteria bacterium]
MSSPPNHKAIWHFLDVRAIWVREFASALSRQVDALGWQPRMSLFAQLARDGGEEVAQEPPLRIRHFALQRGFARLVPDLLGIEARRLDRMVQGAVSAGCARPVLVCSSPHYAGLASRWRGVRIYYATDLFAAWGENPSRIRRLERAMCRSADFVFPDSQRIADHLIKVAGCDPARITVSPMATRAASLLPEPRNSPAELPADVRDMRRPVVGIIGNLANNMDWLLLKEAVARTPWASWLFVGPTDMPVHGQERRRARDELVGHGGRVRFVGGKPYGTLRDYARGVDVAVLPYLGVEPTFSGSSTRFYEHLAACRPILATRGFEELLHKEPLLSLVDSGVELAAALEALRGADFRDGRETLRWSTSRVETWEERARQMIQVVASG